MCSPRAPPHAHALLDYIDINVFWPEPNQKKNRRTDSYQNEIRRKSMKPASSIAVPVFMLAFLSSAAWSQPASDAKTPYPAMAPLQQYLMPDQAAEIALARSAAPESIARDAEVLVLREHGYETAVHGSNGFVCLVERGWTAPLDNPDFWNPRLRGPLCLNAAAARTYLPITLMKTKLVLDGKSPAAMSHAIESALDTKQLPPLEPGAMCYMLSKQQYLGDEGKNWHPHLMFFVPQAAAKDSDWGANLSSSPILASDDPQDRLIIFMIPVQNWSDGTPGPPAMH
jgi:hypothetical protein